MFQKLKNSFKEPIYKDDLKRVLLYGALNMLLFAIFAGAVQYFVSTYINIEFGILVYLVAFMIGKKISDSFFTYHIWYPIISVLYFLVGYFIYRLTMIVFLFNSIIDGIRIYFSWNFVYLTMPFLWFPSYSTGEGILYNIIEILIVSISIITAWQLPARKNR